MIESGASATADKVRSQNDRKYGDYKRRLRDLAGNLVDAYETHGWTRSEKIKWRPKASVF